MFKVNCILLFQISKIMEKLKTSVLMFSCSPVIYYFVICSHSDANLDNGTIKEEDKTVLLEGGQLKSPSTKFRNLSTKANLIRYCLKS